MKIKKSFNFHGKYSVLNFFPVQELIFVHSFKLQKMEFGQKFLTAELVSAGSSSHFSCSSHSDIFELLLQTLSKLIEFNFEQL